MLVYGWVKYVFFQVLIISLQIIQASFTQCIKSNGPYVLLKNLNEASFSSKQHYLENRNVVCLFMNSADPDKLTQEPPDQDLFFSFTCRMLVIC